MKLRSYEEVLNDFMKKNWTDDCMQKQCIPFEWASTRLVVFCEDWEILSQTRYT